MKSPELVCTTFARLIDPWPATRLMPLVLVVAILADCRPADARPLTPADVARLQSVVSVAVSPDESLVAFTVAEPLSPDADKDGPPKFALWVGAPRANDFRVWLRSETTIGSPAFSPDGTRLGFAVKREGDKAMSVWAMPTTGGEAVRLLHSKSGVRQWSWAQDGATITALEAVPPTKSEEKRRKAGYDQSVVDETWTHFRLVRQTVPSRLDEPGREPTVLSRLEGEPFGFDISPNGATIAVFVAPTSLVDDEYMARRLVLVDASTGAPLGEVKHTGKKGQVKFSSDGQRLVFTAGANTNDPSQGRFWRVAPGGGTPDAEMVDRQADVADFWPLPGGAFLLLTEEGTQCRLDRWTSPGKAPTRAFDKSDFSIRQVALPQNAKRAYAVADTPTSPAALWRLPLDKNGPPELLFDPNSWLSDIDWGKQETIRWQARDGQFIEGVLIHPLGKPAGLAPLIVSAHGGPEAHVRSGWVTAYALPGQVAAAEGYYVLYPNYRGSTGRGHAFAISSQGDPGGREFDDIIDGVDHLVNLGWVDNRRVGITGGSYGGYLTAWAATRHSERFAAGVMFVGISNQVSKVGTTDIPNEVRLVHWLTTPAENMQLFVERSPIHWAHQAQTPLLIMHGARDTRVDPGQSREMYSALRRKGDVPTRLVLYPREGHGHRNSAARYDYHLRMMQWFDHFVKAGRKDLPPANLEVPEAAQPPG